MGTSGETTRAIGPGNPPIEGLGPQTTSSTLGMPYWQLQRAFRQSDTFSRQAPSQANRLTQPPVQGVQQFLHQLGQWLDKHGLDRHPELKDLLAKRPGEANGQAEPPAKASGKKRRRAAAASSISIGETDFSCKTTSGKVPHQAALYGQDEEESGVEEGGSSDSEAFSGPPSNDQQDESSWEGHDGGDSPLAAAPDDGFGGGVSEAVDDNAFGPYSPPDEATGPESA